MVNLAPKTYVRQQMLTWLTTLIIHTMFLLDKLNEKGDRSVMADSFHSFVDSSKKQHHAKKMLLLYTRHAPNTIFSLALKHVIIPLIRVFLMSHSLGSKI